MKTKSILLVLSFLMFVILSYSFTVNAIIRGTALDRDLISDCASLSEKIGWGQNDADDIKILLCKVLIEVESLKSEVASLKKAEGRVDTKPSQREFKEHQGDLHQPDK